MMNGWAGNNHMNHRSRILLISCLLICCLKSPIAGQTRPFELGNAEQLIIVVGDNWSTIKANLYGFEKQRGIWLLQFTFPAVLGQKGMALGKGIQTIDIPEAPQKKEGDMKSPAGFFSLGPAFGYADKTSAAWIHISYIQASDTLICVDDPHSGSYNELIQEGSAKADWNSHEEMHRKDKDYRWGLFVQHNFNPVNAGMGSCIFLHIWEGADLGTAGCTAMEEQNILKVLHWIRADKHPVLVQFPEIVYNKIRKSYSLPDL
jgi:L,D-peptidoglycan transpeptidase YkuD (ErfK/YbiS/YcfS/YnhG family)